MVSEAVFSGDDTVVLDTSSHSEALDMAIMNRCDHGILSIGTCECAVAPCAASVGSAGSLEAGSLEAARWLP